MSRRVEAIGSTQRGIGPYIVTRLIDVHAIRLGDLYFDPTSAEEDRTHRGREKSIAQSDRARISRTASTPQAHSEYVGYAEKLKPSRRGTRLLTCSTHDRSRKRLCSKAAKVRLLSTSIMRTFPARYEQQQLGRCAERTVRWSATKILGGQKRLQHLRRRRTHSLFRRASGRRMVFQTLATPSTTTSTSTTTPRLRCNFAVDQRGDARRTARQIGVVGAESISPRSSKVSWRPADRGYVGNVPRSRWWGSRATPTTALIELRLAHGEDHPAIHHLEAAAGSCRAAVIAGSHGGAAERHRHQQGRDADAGRRDARGGGLLPFRRCGGTTWLRSIPP